jgi:phosphoserine phosphatase
VLIHRPDRLRAVRAHPRLLLVSDVDSTFIAQEVIELVAAYAGTADQVAEVTEAAMRGDLDFAESLRARVATLAGVPVAVLREIPAQVTLTPGAVEVLDWARANGHVVGLVSGGFHEVVDPLAEAHGIRHVRANRFEVADGCLTGRVDGAIVDRPGKARAVRAYAAAEHLPLAACVAVGDGANDLDMMAVAGLGVAFAAKPLVAAAADVALPGPRLDDLIALLDGTPADLHAASPAAY